MTDYTSDFLATMTAMARFCRKMMDAQATAGTMTDTEVVAVGSLAKPWEPGSFALNDLRQRNGLLYRCCQAHDSTANPTWEPGTVPALWALAHTTDPNHATPFVQPTGAHDVFMLGECTVYDDGITYRSTVDNNDHAPGVVPGEWEVVEM